ncbi:MAG TPA: LysR family transcriptional regulator, partial [Roseateles sp.]|nr:LysR family transcriptional regulator [Roseateles sp.]
MTLTDLKYIVALSRTRHFGRAAEACFVAQPTLSVAVKKLEEQLGVALFERAPGEVRPTEIGMQVVAQAERTLAEAARVGEIAAAAQASAGVLQPRQLCVHRCRLVQRQIQQTEIWRF